MSIASRITAMTEHIDDIYDTVELTGVDTTGLNKNLVNVPNTLKDGFVDIINNGVDTLYENFPKVAQTGEETTLNGVYEAPMRIDLNGNTEQDSYSGKNLYQVIGTTHNGLTGTLQSDGTLKISGKATHTSSNITTEMSTNLPAGTYTFSITKTVPFRVLLRGDNNANIGVIQPGSTSHTFTTTSVNTTLKVFLYLLEVDTTYDEVIGVQLEAGSPATSFEPYVGGTASPNPDYPQPIRVVKGDNTIKVTGKNLLPYPYTQQTITSNGVTFTVNNDGTVLVNGTATGGTATIKLYGDYQEINNKDLFGKYVYGGSNDVRLRVVNNTNNVYTALATDTGSGAEIDTSTYKKGYIELAVLNGTTVNNQLIKPMVLNDLTATEYQPYQEQTYPLNLGTTELCKIGDYQDYFMKPSGKNLLLYTLESLKTINTQGTWTDNVYSYNGVDYTVNDDLTIKTSGTASGASYLIINNDLNLTSGTDYKLNGCPTGGGVSTYAIRLYTGNDYVSQTGLDFPFTFGTQNLIRINVFSGTNVDNLVFRPMVRLSSVTDSEYEPNQTNKWYKKNYIGKQVFTDKSQWSQASSQYTGTFSAYKQINDLMQGASGTQLYCNYFVGNTYESTNQGITKNINSKNVIIRIDSTIANTLTSFRDWIETNTPTLYYPLETPTYTEITDTDLINQLEDLKNAKSVEGQTNITQTNEELPFILDVSGLKKD